MPTVEQVAIPLASICSTVPSVGPGVCERCHGCPKPDWPICWSCELVERQVTTPCKLIVPISLYRVGGQLHHQLRTYKTGSQAARTLRRQTAGILGYFLKLHTDCIAEAANGRWTRITSVPSSTGRIGEHPLETAINLLPDIRHEYEPLLQPGPTQITHQYASDDAFQALYPLTGERVLLIDDTFTSGERARRAPPPHSPPPEPQSSRSLRSDALSPPAPPTTQPTTGNDRQQSPSTSRHAVYATTKKGLPLDDRAVACSPRCRCGSRRPALVEPEWGTAQAQAGWLRDRCLWARGARSPRRVIKRHSPAGQPCDAVRVDFGWLH
jgi:hypothetical protein